MKYNVYKVHSKTKYPNSHTNESQLFHKLELLKRLDTLQEAEEWWKENHEKFTDYTILPSYYFTPFDEE